MPHACQEFMSEAILIFLPLLFFIPYYGLFKWMLWKSQKQ